MKSAFIHIKYFGLVLTTFVSFSFSARAGQIFIDDGVGIYKYPPASALTVGSTFSNAPGSGVLGMAFTGKDSNLAPQDVLLTAAGNNNKIYAYTQQGVQSIFASVSDPVGLAVNGAGDVYTATNGTTIEEFSPVGVLLNGSVATGLDVNSLAFDVAGDLYEADNGTGDINEFLVGGGEKTFASFPSAGNFYGMTFDLEGDLFVSYQDSISSGGIFEITPGGIATTFFSTNAFLPTSVGFDPLTGNLYMTYVTSFNAPGGGADVFVNSGGTLNNTPVAFANGLDAPYSLAVLTPEPGSLLLLAGGLVSIALLRFHRVRLKTCRAN